MIALSLLDGTRRSRKKVTAANVAFYTIKYLRSGRRSTGYRKADAMHPAARLNGRCRVHSFEERVAIDRSTDEPLTLGEILPARDDELREVTHAASSLRVTHVPAVISSLQSKLSSPFGARWSSSALTLRA